MTLRVRVRPGCNGLGTCVRLAPELFRIDQATGKAVVIRENADGCRDRLDRIRESCPFIAVEVDGVPVDEPIDEVTVEAVKPLTSDVIELRLLRPGYSFKPGQYAFVRMKDAEGEFFRAYSLVGVDVGQVTFCIKVLPTGRGGRALRALKPGDTIGLGRALGTFTLSSTDRSKLFVTGGTGVAPVVPMCQASPAADKTVIFGVRTEADLFWMDRLRAIPRTTVIPVLEVPGPTWTGARGRVTDALHELDVTAFSEVYTCGSPGMVKAVHAQLTECDFDEKRIFADSFDSAKPTTPAVEPFDWQGLVRRLHFYSSVSLAGLFLFFALTGLVANRVNLFVAEGTGKVTTPTRLVPESVALDQASINAFLAGVLPATARAASFIESPKEIKATFTLPATGTETEQELIATVQREDRNLAIEEWRRLPDGIAIEADALSAYLRLSVSGDPDLKNREDDDKELRLDFGSVWGVHTVQVDTAKRRWQMSTTRPETAVALIDLHRGKHAGFVQKLLVDLTGLLLVFVTLSGIAMGLGAAARIRRFATLVLAGGSLVLLVILLLSR